jgi:hypothetical protein
VIAIMKIGTPSKLQILSCTGGAFSFECDSFWTFGIVTSFGILFAHTRRRTNTPLLYIQLGDHLSSPESRAQPQRTESINWLGKVAFLLRKIASDARLSLFLRKQAFRVLLCLKRLAKVRSVEAGQCWFPPTYEKNTSEFSSSIRTCSLSRRGAKTRKAQGLPPSSLHGGET